MYTVEYVIVTAVVSALYLIVKQWLPDFPVSDVVFQTVILYLLAKVGINVVGKPAEAIRKLFNNG
jgi:hypothetical protein